MDYLDGCSNVFERQAALLFANTPCNTLITSRHIISISGKMRLKDEAISIFDKIKRNFKIEEFKQIFPE